MTTTFTTDWNRTPTGVRTSVQAGFGVTVHGEWSATAGAEGAAPGPAPAADASAAAESGGEEHQQQQQAQQPEQHSSASSDSAAETTTTTTTTLKEVSTIRAPFYVYPIWPLIVMQWAGSRKKGPEMIRKYLEKKPTQE